MLDFRLGDKKAKFIAIHYAKQLNNGSVLEMLKLDRLVTDKNEAILLAQFYWEILDALALDQENDISLYGETNQPFWMERRLNIFGGYL